MADAAHAAEDLIETRAPDPIRKRKDFNGSFQSQPKQPPMSLESWRPPSAASCEKNVVCLQGIRTKIPDKHFYGSFQRIIEGLDLLRKEVMEMNPNNQSQQGNNQPPPPSSQSATYGEKAVVGVEGIEMEIIEKLISQHKSDRKIISISGMGGIGKTTLARKVYDSQYIKDYFDICAWATISKDYNIHESLVELLHCLDGKESKHDLRRRREHELCDKLHKSLFDRRYIVILDDVWDAEAWYRLKSFFPASKGSGIVITTRESAFDSISSLRFRMDLLDEHKSWDLLCKTVFGKDSCPPELENTGKSVAKKCKGLSLSIGGHLAKSERKTKEYWEYVERDITSIVSSEDDEHCHKILSLSYAHLPVHLKPCFLYMAAFPEDDEIAVSELIKLWVSEGFLRPIDGQSLEEVARHYLNDLINRNLILAYKSSRRGKIKTCKIHDLLRDLCVKEASKRNFLRIHGYHDSSEVLSNAAQRVVVPFNSNLHHLPSLRTLIYDDSMLSSLACKSLRVLYSAKNCRYLGKNFITEAARELVNLRHLKIPNLYDREFTIPPSISSLWNLQSLFIGTTGHFKAPKEILEMFPLLRHIRIKRFYIPDAPPSESSCILRNLQSVENIENWSFTEDFVARVPNIKKLKVTYDTQVGEFSDAASLYLRAISRLEKLESFKCSFKDGPRFFDNAIPERTVASSPSFPRSLKKLSCGRIRWDDVMTMIGSLPLLEVLILRDCSGSEWVPVEGQQFVRLRHLDISRCRLKSFEGDANRFPCLERLVLKFMFRLEEISSDIGDIPTLRSIEMDACPDSAVRCAKEIAEYQYDLASELQVTVQLGSLSELSPESLSTCNFRVQNY